MVASAWLAFAILFVGFDDKGGRTAGVLQWFALGFALAVPAATVASLLVYLRKQTAWAFAISLICSFAPMGTYTLIRLEAGPMLNKSNGPNRVGGSS
jgi:hypothetical protein